MLGKAQRSLDAARAHLAAGDFDFAASRAYYAAFYAMESALLREGITCSTHGGVLKSFSKHFIKPGGLPVEFGTMAARLFRERQIGDYEFDVSITPDDASQDIEISASMVRDLTAHWLTIRGESRSLFRRRNGRCIPQQSFVGLQHI